MNDHPHAPALDPDQPGNEQRRDLFKLAALSTGGALLGAAPGLRAHDNDGASKRVTPFVDALPIPPIKQTVPVLDPPTRAIAQIENGECGHDPLEYLESLPPQKLYELEVRAGEHRWHRDYPPQMIAGYDGMFPGPTFDEDYGVPSIVRLRNRLLPGDGFGVPEISMHLHNMHTPSESDGYPGDFWSRVNAGPTLTAPGEFKDHHFLQQRAGFTAAPETFGDPDESLGTLWYHDHCLDFTTANTYAGMVGMCRIHDELDTGVETAGLRLPAGAYDVPLVLADRQFTRDGFLRFDPSDTDGLIGDRYTVNGKIQPKFAVHRRRYRLRVLNSGPARVYQLGLRYGTTRPGFTYIANDGNLLPTPIIGMTRIVLAAAERADIIIDFSAFPTGSQVYLVNRFEQTDGRRPTGRILAGDRILRFDVGTLPPQPDLSVELTATTPLRPLPRIDLSEVAARRRFDLDRKNGVWTVDGRIFDATKARFTVRMGSAEIWTLRNTSGNWWHPVHIHLEQGRLLSRNGRKPPRHERGRKDTFSLRPGEEVEVFLRFRDCHGKYVMHCHNLAHEDHAMMMRFDVEA